MGDLMSATEWRPIVAHSESCGQRIKTRDGNNLKFKPRTGRKIQTHFKSVFCRPIRGFCNVCLAKPMAGAMGYCRALLRS